VREKDFLNWVIQTAETFNWLVKHVPAPMVAAGDTWRPYKKAAGLPDLFLLHDDPPRMVIAEVKGTNGKLSDAQRQFLRMARDVAEYVGRTSWTAQELAEADLSERTLGVYVFQPGMEEAITQILRTRVLS
jgi:VRR-NUC domain